jgi:TRAP-type C4-dicarboxylate transport system permease small subunit
MAVCLAAMALLIGADILGRLVLNASIFWADEATRYLLVWTAFLGMSVGAYRGAHPGVDTLVRRLPAEAGRWAALAATLLTLAFFAVMLGYGGLLALRTAPQRSATLGLSMGLPYLAVPVSGLLMLLHGAARWAAGARERRDG